MKKEFWKPVVGYEGLYEVSNFGRVKSIKFGKEIIMKQNIRRGYYYVGLHKNGKVKNFQVHRLVAEAFIQNPNNLPQVNHKDENKQNNNAENLEWCDNKYNINYGSCIKRRSKKLTKPILQFTLDGVFVKEWDSIAECGRNGFDSACVCMCCKGERKSHKGFIWRY